MSGKVFEEVFISFTPNIPASGQTLGQTRQAILDNFAILRSTLAVDHVDVNASGNGKHKFVHFTDASSSIPATTATELALYNKLVGGAYRLFMRQISSGTEIQMSGIDPLTANPGYTFLPGGLLLQWGTTTAVANSAGNTINFPIAFSTVFVVTCTVQTNDNSTIRFSLAGSPSNGSFDTTQTQTTHFTKLHWMAIGTKN